MVGRQLFISKAYQDMFLTDEDYFPLFATLFVYLIMILAGWTVHYTQKPAYDAGFFLVIRMDEIRKQFIFFITQCSSFFVVFECVSCAADIWKRHPCLAYLGSRSLLPRRNVLKPVGVHYAEDHENCPAKSLWSSS